MTRFSHLLRRFGRDEGGVFAVIFGLMAIVLVAVGGAVVDYVQLEQTRNRAQIALDAAALALQPEIFPGGMTTANIQLAAQRLLDNRIGDSRVTAVIERTVPNPTDGSLFFEARFNMPTFFVRLVGVPELGARIRSEATRKKLALEIMMVLDNSGSMDDENRMKYLKEAAACATNILFYTAVIDDPLNANTCIKAPTATQVADVKVGIVPFTMYVNVGASNRNQAWMDRDGVSPISANNFDDDDDASTPFNGPLNRFALYDGIANESWAGCVEARPHTRTDTLNPNAYLDTDDTAPTASNPASLFVPLFAPDLPSGYGGQNYISDTPAACQATGVCTQTWTDNSCTSTAYNSCGSTSRPSTGTLVGKNLGNQGTGTCSCNTSAAPTTTSTSTSGWGSSLRYNRTRTWVCNFQYNPQGLSTVELMERICKYRGATTPTGSAGPNNECPSQAILPLTTTVKDVTDKIAAMVALGGTNIHEGTAWGFRALSPTQPFNQGAAYDEATSKVMIIMTDGENTAYNLPHTNLWQNNGYCSSTITNLLGNCFNSAYGYPRNHNNPSPRMGPMGTNNASLVTQMNERTRQTCANAKAAGITIYTIGLATNKVSQSTQAEVESMLRDCATGGSARAHFPTSPTQLKSVFQEIANDLSALRLAQ